MSLDELRSARNRNFLFNVEGYLFRDLILVLSSVTDDSVVWVAGTPLPAPLQEQEQEQEP